MTNNELISRAAAIDALTDTNLRRNVDSVCDGDMNRTRRAAQRVIAQLPAVDAVPVIRCKDCKNWERDWTPLGTDGERHWCGPYDGFPDADFFCADAKRADAPTCGPDYCELEADDE